MRFTTIEIRETDCPWDAAPPWAIELRAMVSRVLEKLESGMATLDQVLADVTAETTAIGSVSTLIAGLQAQLAAATSGALSPAQQAQVDAIFAAAESNKAGLAAALAANVPPAAPAP